MFEFSEQLTSRFTADIVMNCIYGLEGNHLVHRNLVEWFSPSLAKNIMNAILSTFPFLTAAYKPSFFPSQLSQWFYDTMDMAVKYRTQNQLNRSDFLNFLLERRLVKGHTNKDLAAFAATFLFDGFETTSMVLAQALYHIAKNDHCQTELRADIFEHFSDGKTPTTDTINKMQYLDNIVNGMVGRL